MHEIAHKAIEAIKEGLGILKDADIIPEEVNLSLEAAMAIVQEFEQLAAERDALLKALKEKDAECECCANADRLEQMDTREEMDFDCDACKADCRCRDCRNNSNWEWRGIQPAEKEAKDEGHTDHQPAGSPADPQGGKN